MFPSEPTSDWLLQMQWLPVARELHRPVGKSDVLAALRELRGDTGTLAGGEKRKREDDGEAAAGGGEPTAAAC